MTDILVLSIQKANKSRKFSMKNKVLLYKYYWENLKSELARGLLLDKKN